jgi:hypothetical protein
MALSARDRKEEGDDVAVLQWMVAAGLLVVDGEKERQPQGQGQLEAAIQIPQGGLIRKGNPAVGVDGGVVDERGSVDFDFDFDFSSSRGRGWLRDNITPCW